MTLTIETFESILNTYDFEEIVELNNLTLADVLEYLVNEQFLELPDPQPIIGDELEWEGIQEHEQSA